ncbi:condensation domain-containing protein [Actinoplanes sp. NPDC049316]|uniref:condensation domain-containing protein n=1 Tax=Actinoplanes sp. NPDC049316 TaxID=3154727 RepID=UPI003439DAB2
MSAGQEALWLAHQLDPDSCAFNVVLAVRVRTPLDPDRLGRAVTALTARHELLRSTFTMTAAGGHVREVRAPETVRLDVRPAPGATDAELFDLARRAGAEPFALDTTGAFRVVLLTRAPGDAVLVTAAHHLVTDATSQWLIVRDLLCLYEDPQASLPAVLPWDDRVRAERELAASARGRRAREHWRTVCASLTGAELLTDRPRPAQRTLNGATHTLALPAALGARIQESAAAHGITPFAWLLGAFQAALHRFGCGAAFLVGCPATTRSVPGTRDAVGYYVNILPVGARFETGPSFRDVITAAGRQMLAGMAHNGLPTELCEGLPPLPVTFTLLAADRLPVPGLFDGPVRHAGLDLELVDVPQQEGQLDLTVEVLQSGSRFTALLRYNRDLFLPATIERLAGVYRRMVEASVEDPDQPVTRPAVVAEHDLAFLLSLGSGAP